MTATNSMAWNSQKMVEALQYSRRYARDTKGHNVPKLCYLGVPVNEKVFSWQEHKHSTLAE